MKNKYFKLYGNCFIVKGKMESLLYDLENQNYYPIPNEIADVLTEIENEEIPINKLDEIYIEKSVDVKNILKYFTKNHLAHFVSSPKSFPKIALEWKSPSKIENAILEFTNDLNYNVLDTLEQLENLGCQAVEIRFIDYFNLKYLSDILDNFITSSFKYYLIATKNNNNTINDYMEFAFKYPRISKLLIFENNYKIYKRLKSSMSKKNKIIYLNRQLKANIDEKISLNSFVINTQTFTEAQNHNIGLNKKVCINSKGKIKNFLTHEKDFGNIQHHKLSEVVDSSSFRNLWNISNDKIEKCKDCQYRYMCLSNSDIEEKAGKFYKINSCTFNPYLNKWK